MADLPSIVLVHGAWHGSWCWDDVAAALRDEGFETLAIDLIGHETPGSSRRFWHSVGTYVDQLSAVVKSLDGEVVVVGHSMGGLVVQRLLERRPVRGAVLVASSPRRGVAPAVLRLLRRDPKQLLQTVGSLSLWPMVENDERVREHFFTESSDEQLVAAAGAKLQNESFVAFLSMIGRWPRPGQVNSPVKVIAGAHDSIFTIDEQTDLAASYDTTPVVLDAGHDLMLEAVWPELAAEIADFARG